MGLSPRALRRPVDAISDLLSGRVTDAAYALGWAAVRALPEPVVQRLFDAGADFAVRRSGKGVRRLRSNLARVAPGRDLTQAAVRSYARYWLEVFRLPVLATSRVLEGTSTVGEPAVRELLGSPRGVVFALPHSGNWDTAAAWFVATGVRFTTVAERLRPESLYDRFVAFRESLGMEVLPLTGGDRPPFEVLAERLQEGGAVCLLADRDLTPRGIDVDFFRARTRMPAGPAALALRTGAALVPVHLAFTPDGWLIRFFPEVEHTDVPAMTQQLAACFEQGIAAHPADWHMLQRLWLDDLEPRAEVP